MQISESVQDEIDIKGTLIESQYIPWEGSETQFVINNLFDDDETNIIHSSKANLITDDNLFIIIDDLGEVINANILTIYGSHQYYYNTYQPKTFVLYGWLDKNNLEVFANVKDSFVVNYNVVVSFNTKSFRYYKLVVTQTHSNRSFI